MNRNKIIKILFYIVFISLFVFIVYCFVNTNYNVFYQNNEDKVLDLTELNFNTTQYKIEGIKSDTIVAYTFIVKNIGNNPLFIHSINPNCLCTNYYISKTKINQQDTAKIVLFIDTKDKQGFYNINTVVIANTEKRYYLLKVIGNIIK